MTLAGPGSVASAMQLVSIVPLESEMRPKTMWAELSVSSDRDEARSAHSTQRAQYERTMMGRRPTQSDQEAKMGAAKSSSRLRNAVMRPSAVATSAASQSSKAANSWKRRLRAGSLATQKARA